MVYIPTGPFRNMDGFIGREKELSELESIYSKKGFKSLIVYGRRRIGKTTLLENFIKDKRALMIYSSESSFYKLGDMRVGTVGAYVF